MRLIVLTASLLFFFGACRKAPTPRYELSYLNGIWERIDGEKLEYDGMQIRIENGSGQIIDIPSGYTEYFQVGNLKWKDISPIGGDFIDFYMFDLSSTGDYASLVKIYSVEQDTINVTHNDITPDGTQQTWVRIQ